MICDVCLIDVFQVVTTQHRKPPHISFVKPINDQAYAVSSDKIIPFRECFSLAFALSLRPYSVQTWSLYGTDVLYLHVYGLGIYVFITMRIESYNYDVR